jgi:hypothetical protein
MISIWDQFEVRGSLHGFGSRVCRPTKNASPKNPIPTLTATNPPQSRTNPSPTVTDPPINAENPPQNVTRANPHSPKFKRKTCRI